MLVLDAVFGGEDDFVPSAWDCVDAGWHRVKDAFDHSSTDATHDGLRARELVKRMCLRCGYEFTERCET